MKRTALAFLTISASWFRRAPLPTWQPAPGHRQIALWPERPPDESFATGPETATTRPHNRLVAGIPWTYISNVSRPTLTVYAPSRARTGVAVVVFPGGGYQILAIDLEGTEACDWLTSIGITCVLVKYRVPNSGPSWDQQCGCDHVTKSSMPLEDAQRAIALVRFHAAELHIDPHSIGVLGFSAGGHLVASVSTRFSHRVYAKVDSADTESSRPDFAVAVYPGHLFDPSTGALNALIQVSREMPPTFLVQAENDDVDGVNNSLIYYAALKNAGVPAELHLYAHGGHAFGLRRTKLPITAWPQMVQTWLRTIGVMSW